MGGTGPADASLESFMRYLASEVGPRGVLGLAVHLGEGAIHGDEQWLGHQVEPLVATLFSEPELNQALPAAGFSVEWASQRNPLPHEYQGPRLYLLAGAA